MIKWKLISATSVLVLILVITLLFQVRIPMCYNDFEEDVVTEAFVLYPVEIVEKIQAQIQQTPFHYIKILGNSMQPTIKNGDVCICVPKTDYNKEDIVSFYIPLGDNVELIAHRIILEENNNFLTKGDNNLNRDMWWLTEEQIFCQIPERSLFDKLRFAVVESEGRFSIFSIINFE